MLTYELLHKDRIVARIDTSGRCEVLEEPFMPYGLVLEDTNHDLDLMVNNLVNFHAWCASRVLTLERRYAKELLNSIGMLQAVTDRERAQIALSYRCLSLTDVFWVREQGEELSFGDVNLYENHLSNAFVEVSLRGKQMSASNMELARDLSTSGCFPKAWVRENEGFSLYKDGDVQAVENELLASRILRCFELRQVLYERGCFDGQSVSVSRIFTGPDYGICTWEQFQIYAVNHDIDPWVFCLALDPVNYYRMNVVDYLIGNTDRHWGNWGFLIDNTTNWPVSLHPLMDFNQSFHRYDSLDGSNALTVPKRGMSQREAAVEGAREAGPGRNVQVPEKLFDGRTQQYEMFCRRLEIVENAVV